MMNYNALPENFWDKVSMEPNSGCWLWTGATTGRSRGGTNLEYGQFTRPNANKLGGAKMQLAHRHAYEKLIGPIPEGLQVDHLCKVTTCVNPNHLEPVTGLENRRRRMPTHCRQGHEFTQENTYIYASGARSCRACNRINGLKYYHARKAAKA